MLTIKVLSIFNWDFGMLISFLMGVLIGFIVFALFNLWLFLSNMRKKKYIAKSQVNQIDDDEIAAMIKESQTLFKDKTIRGENSSIAHCTELTSNLVKNIARKFFPKSKHPLLELTVDEILMLTVYISNRLDQLLDAKTLRIFRKIRISTIIGLTEAKQAIDDNVLMKATKKYRIKEAFTAASGVINLVNPIFWVRKLAINKMIGVVINKICIVLIGIVGEETYKIYSKSVFNEDVDLDTGVDKLVDDIDKDIKNTQE